jgi:hypothetical protein
MNAVAELSIPLPSRTEWDAIFAEVNAWRGSCMHHISAVEMAGTEALLALSEVPSKGGTIRLRQLVGQRFEDLSAAIGPNGPFADAGGAAYLALSQYREHQEAFRALLCHGVFKVTVDPHHQWTLVIRSFSVRARQAERALLVIDQAEAQARLTSLKREGQQLVSALGQLRKKVRF